MKNKTLNKSRYIKLFKILSVSILFFSSVTAFGQPRININFTIPPPYPVQFSAYEDKMNDVLVMINNPSNITRRVYFHATITRRQGGRAFTNPAYKPAVPFIIDPFQMVALRASEIGNLNSAFNASNMDVEGLDLNLIQRLGVIPEGDYTICVTARDFDTDMDITAASSGCSNMFQVLHAMPPRLNAPVNNFNFCNDFGIISFTWTPVMRSASAMIVYDLEMIDLTRHGVEDVEAGALFEEGIPRFYTVENLPSTFYNFTVGVIAPPFDNNHLYAWRVRARDINETTFIQDEGYSDIFKFRYCPTPSGDAFATEVIYPLDKDTIPFSFPFLAVEYSPQSRDYTRLEYNIRLFRKDGTGSEFYKNVNITYGPSGPKERIKSHWPDATDKQCKSIALLRSSDFPMLERGKTYQWGADVKMFQGSRRYDSRIGLKEFTYGMPKPKPSKPAHREAINPEALQHYEFEFSLGKMADKFFPPHTIIELENHDAAGAKYREIRSVVNERWVIQVSKNDSLFEESSKIVCSKTGLFEFDLPMRGEIDKEEVKDKFKEKIKVTLNDTWSQVAENRADGNYFWRVGWSKEPSDVDNPASSVYLWSNAHKLVLDSTVENTRRSPGDESDCMDDCEIEAPTLREQKVVVVGDTVRVGRFTLKITNITNPGASNKAYNGMGWIKVPFLSNIRVSVNFENLKVNNNNQMFAGKVEAEKHESIVNINVQNVHGLGIPDLDIEGIANVVSWVESNSRLATAAATGYPIGVPIGYDHQVGDERTVLAIVEMEFTPEGAKLNGVVNFPFNIDGRNYNIGLGAANVCFSPTGLNTNSSILYLANNIDIPFKIDNDNEVLITFKGLTDPDFSFTPGASSRANVTQVRFDCNGFKDFYIHIATTFPRSFVIPENREGSVLPDTTKLIGTGSGMGDASGGFMIGLNFNYPFYFVGLEDISFTLSNAWFDFSTKANPTGFSFPEGYADRAMASTDRTPSLTNTWKGFYMENIEVRFKHFQSTNPVGDRRFTVGLEKMMIDQTGFSAKIYLANLVSWRERTDMVDGWAFSLDTIDIKFVSNNLVSGSISARLGFPLDEGGTQFLKSKFTLAYEHSTGKFKFTATVKPESNFVVNAWVARLELDRSSKLDIIISDNPEVKAEFTGRLSITSNARESIDDLPGSFTMPEMRFERITISSKTGFGRGGTINGRPIGSASGLLGSTSSGGSSSGGSGTTPNNANRMAGFPIELEEVSLDVRDGSELALGVQIRLTFTRDGSGISAATKLNFVSRFDLPTTSLQGLEVELENISIALLFDPIEIKGRLEIRKTKIGDRGYEERFLGSLDIKLPANLRGRLEGEFGSYVANPDAEYGSPENFSFFRIDGRVSGFSITLCPWLAVTGFGGGFYHRMKIQDKCAMPRIDGSASPSGGYGSSAAAIPSGTRYIRDYETVFGFRVMLEGGFPGDDEVFNLDVSLGAEIASRAGGSIVLQRLDFEGDIYVLTKKSERNNPKIYAALKIAYENPPAGPPLISGSFDLYVSIKLRDKEILKGNMLAGSSVFPDCPSRTNASCNCRAVAARLHIPLTESAGSEWYFYMGHWSPEEVWANRGRLLFNLEDVARVEISQYLMAGNGLPRNLPPVPDRVAQILYGEGSDGDPEARASLAAETGRVAGRLTGPRDEMRAAGFALGANVEAEIMAKFAIFYASFYFNIGFDINITKSVTECRNPAEPGATFMRGLDGWYGQGQAYMAMEGELGVFIDLFAIKGKFPIVSLAAAVMIKAGLPNPEYFQGRVGLRYSLLCGMVKGHCNFKMDIGQKCEEVTENPFGVNLISDMSPSGSDVSVFVNPTVSYNFPIDEILTFEEIVDEQEGTVRLRHLRAFIHSFDIRRDGASTAFPSGFNTNRQGDLTTLRPASWLEAETRYHSRIVLRAMEYISRFSPEGSLVYRGGRPWEENREVRFTTGERPDHIPDENLEYTYPINNQRFYLQEEGMPGLFLTQPMPGLLVPDRNGREYRYYVRLINISSNDTVEHLLQNSIDQLRHWQFVMMRLNNLGLDNYYCLQIVGKPVISRNPFSVNTFNMPNVLRFENIIRRTTYGSASGGVDASTSEVTERKIAGSTIGPNEHLIYRYYFKTSKYRNLQDKLASSSLNVINPTHIGTLLSSGIDEYFDVYDVAGYSKNGVQKVAPLIALEKDNTINTLNNRMTQTYDQYNNIYNQMHQYDNAIQRTIFCNAGCRRATDILVRNPNQGVYRPGIPAQKTVFFNDNLVKGPITQGELLNAGSRQGFGLHDLAGILDNSGILDRIPPITGMVTQGSGHSVFHFSYNDPLAFAFQYGDMKSKINRMLNYTIETHIFSSHANAHRSLYNVSARNPFLDYAMNVRPALWEVILDFNGKPTDHFYFRNGRYGIKFISQTPLAARVFRSSVVTKSFNY